MRGIYLLVAACLICVGCVKQKPTTFQKVPGNFYIKDHNIIQPENVIREIFVYKFNSDGEIVYKNVPYGQEGIMQIGHESMIYCDSHLNKNPNYKADLFPTKTDDDVTSEPLEDFDRFFQAPPPSSDVTALEGNEEEYTKGYYDGYNSGLDREYSETGYPYMLDATLSESYKSGYAAGFDQGIIAMELKTGNN